MLPKPEKKHPPTGKLSPYNALFDNFEIVRESATLHMTPHLQPCDEQFEFCYTATCNKRERVVAVFLEMEEAFNRVWYTGTLSTVLLPVD